MNIEYEENGKKCWKKQNIYVCHVTTRPDSLFSPAEVL